MAVEARGCIGSVYRITADFLDKRGLIEQVKAELPPESRKVLEKLPFPFAWQDARALEDIEKALHARSPRLPADLGFAAAESLSRGMIAPVLQMAMSLFGQTPTSIFSKLDRFFSMVVRGFSFRYEERGPKEGVVFAQIGGGAAHESLFQQLKGNLHIIFELCRVKGTVGEPEVIRSDAAGAEIKLPVRWE